MRTLFTLSALVATVLAQPNAPIPVIPTPANNNVAPQQAAIDRLNNYDNIITIIMTANSFDYLFGTFPGANGASSTGPVQVDRSGRAYDCLPADNAGYLNSAFGSACIPNRPFVLNSPDNPVLGINQTVSADPKHTFYTNQYNVNGGAMDGLVYWAGKQAGMAMGYYDLSGSYYFELAKNFTLFDNFFQSAWGGVMLNHQYFVTAEPMVWNNTHSNCPAYVGTGKANTSTAASFAADGKLTSPTSDGLFTPSNIGCYVVNNVHPNELGSAPNIPPSNVTTIGELLTAANVDWKFYFETWDQTVISSSATKEIVSTHEIPFAYYAPYAHVNGSLAQAHIKDLEAHFAADLAAGTLPPVSWLKPNQAHGGGITDNTPVIGGAWLQNVMNQIFASAGWKNNKTMVVVTFSDSDGAYDHVAPYAGDLFGPGTRVPTIMISPDHVNGGVNHQPYETLSIMKMIQRRFNIPVGSLMSAARNTACRDLTNSICEVGSCPTSPSHANSAASATFTWTQICLALVLVFGMSSL